MQKQFFKGLVTKISEGKYKVLASTSAIDRQGDSIDQNGWDLSNFKLNPVMPWAHDYGELPIAKCTSIEVTKRGLEAEFEFAPAEGNPKAQQIKVLYDEGYLNAVSVGFIAKERRGNVITKAELLEISIVPVPANQEALRLALSKGLDVSEVPEVKGAIEAEMNAEEAFEKKWENWCELNDVMSAFWKVYFDEMTPVDDFKTLLQEVVDLLQMIANGETLPSEEGETVMDGLVGKSISPETSQKFLDFIADQKQGRTLSQKTLDTIDAAIESMKSASSVLEDLKSSSVEQDGKNETSQVEEKGTEEETIDVPVIEEKIISLSAGDLKLYRQKLVANDKNNELVLSIVNAHMREKGIK